MLGEIKGDGYFSVIKNPREREGQVFILAVHTTRRLVFNAGSHFAAKQ
jgi:hypothetical protein